MKLSLALSTLLLITSTHASHIINETSTRITLSNTRLHLSLAKSFGAIDTLLLDSQNLLGIPNSTAQTGIGPYLDCHCIPGGSGSYTPFRNINTTTYTLLNGTDPSGLPWTGIIQHEIYEPTNQSFTQYFFLRGEETGLHTFTRVTYHNSSYPGSTLRDFAELRTLFRPNTQLWTHLYTNAAQYAPLPWYNPANYALGTESGANSTILVQDTTWLLTNTSDPYFQQESEYFTKYTFSDTWRDHTVHGLYSDSFGAWFIPSPSKDTYFGGPTHSDLTVDGIVYDYIISNHHGDCTPNITDGFQRTFGPGFYYFNHGSRQDAEDVYQRAKMGEWMEFYDGIAEFVTGYVPSSGRGRWEGRIQVPWGAERAVAVLSVSGVDYQDNCVDVDAYQYWADVGGDGRVVIEGVKAGTYRLTVHAKGIFGQYEHDGIVVEARKTTKTRVVWKPESAGKELWRIGIPDYSSGEYRHGDAKDPTHPLHPAERRIYWGAYDFVEDFPNGVSFEVGNSSIAKDLNYVHWSVFGGVGNHDNPKAEPGNGNVNNWTIIFDVAERDLSGKTDATFTVQLAGAKTAAGNTDVFNASQLYSNLPYTVSVNGRDLEPWIIPYYQSSSCAVRSAVSCYHLAHKFVFGIEDLRIGRNELVLSLPWNATDYESAVLGTSVYVQYDALRLEVR